MVGRRAHLAAHLYHVCGEHDELHCTELECRILPEHELTHSEHELACERDQTPVPVLRFELVVHLGVALPELVAVGVVLACVLEALRIVVGEWTVVGE